MNGDVDQKGGYDPPTSVSDLSIHHTFSRCVTVHGSNGLLVSDMHAHTWTFGSIHLSV
jgi:cell migration-inducing and hyaluronan-binding protein